MEKETNNDDFVCMKPKRDYHALLKATAKADSRKIGKEHELAIIDRAEKILPPNAVARQLMKKLKEESQKDV